MPQAEDSIRTTAIPASEAKGDDQNEYLPEDFTTIQPDHWYRPDPWPPEQDVRAGAHLWSTAMPDSTFAVQPQRPMLSAQSLAVAITDPSPSSSAPTIATLRRLSTRQSQTLRSGVTGPSQPRHGRAP